MNKKVLAIVFAILAAAFYAVNVPFSKILLSDVGPSMMSSYLYLGAGISMGCLFLYQRKNLRKEDLLERKDLPYTIGMVVLDIAAPILLMYGITMTTSENVSLLNNFEIVATALIALMMFKEKISRNLWVAIILIVISGAILTFENSDGFVINAGSLCVLGACCCWGLENNCTRAISDKSSSEIVMVKGLCSGTGCFIIATLTGETVPEAVYILLALLLGTVSYGLSINLYIMAQRHIGAAKTGAYYAVAPFLGVVFAFIFCSEIPGPSFFVAFAIMAVATAMVIRDTLGTEKEHIHNHEHRHGDLVHSHPHGRFHHIVPLHIRHRI